jgi:capsular polysaccharide biosynthesis protein
LQDETLTDPPASGLPAPGQANIALGKRAWQSSTSAWSRGASVLADAAGAISGRLTGAFQFHTELENGPWWRIDLGAPHALSEIRLYNRIDEPETRLRLRRFVIEASFDGVTWTTIYTHDGTLIGGADGHPLVLRAPDDSGQPLVGHHLRIRVLERTWLHLDQVEIFGEEWLHDVPPAADPAPAQDVGNALDDVISLLSGQSAAPSPQPPGQPSGQPAPGLTRISEAAADRPPPPPSPGVPPGMLTRPAVVQRVLDLFDAPRYLEIGVDSGQTFHSVTADLKIAVDPAFKFAPPVSTAAVQYYPVTSDQYFARHCPPGQLFDVIFVDGLHQFEQTLRDMLNAVMRLSEHGVVIIDDILPASYHASLPDLGDAFMVRNHLSPGSQDATWMGDVYKVAFFVQTFMQQFSFATVQETHGQLIAWRTPRQTADVGERSMLDIAMLSFLDTVKQRSVFRIRPMDAIIEAMHPFAGRAAAQAAPPQPAPPAPPTVKPATGKPPTAPSYVSCGAELLYAQGGFSEGPDRLDELRRNAGMADFITDVGEVFPAYAPHRTIVPESLIGSPAFIEKLLAHYAWINSVFTRGAASRVVRLTDVYLHRNTLHHIAGDAVVTLYETARPIDRNHSLQPLWTPEDLRAQSVAMRCANPSLYLGSAGSSNYGHWLIDDLTRLEALEQIGHHAGASLVDVILPGSSGALNAVREQSLFVARSGRMNGDTQFVSPNQLTHFDELYYVTPLTHHPVMKSPAACRRLRERVRAASRTPTGPANVYLLRGPSHGRAIENQTEVTQLFQTFGFKLVDVDGMSFAEQVAAVSGAQVVAGCMGAAMTNALFCDPGTTVLQLAPEGWVEPFYWDLANVCGHAYTTLFGAVSNTTVEPHTASFTIDPTLLSDVLSSLVRFGDWTSIAVEAAP